MIRKQLLDVWRHRGVNWGWFRVHCIMYSQWVNLFGDYYEELLDTNTIFQEIHHYFIQETVMVVECFDIQIDSEFHQMNEMRVKNFESITKQSCLYKFKSKVMTVSQTSGPCEKKSTP